MGENSKVKVLLYIYLSHSLSAWGDRMWDFGVGLYMIILYPDSLLLTAILGFAVSFSVIAFGSVLGTWIDKTKRITSAVAAVIIQNTAVILGSIVLALTFAFQDDIQSVWNGSLTVIIYATIIALSIVSKLASVASLIAIEGDWIVVLSEGDADSLTSTAVKYVFNFLSYYRHRSSLSSLLYFLFFCICYLEMNSIMRTIDLTSKILAPVFIGSLISWSQISSAIVIAVWNAISGLMEIYFLRRIYRQVPHLGEKQFITTEKSSSSLRKYWSGWKQYLTHPVKWAGIGFSCMYMTVLGLDQVSIGYMYSEGVEESYIGISLALAAVIGILGSLLYPFLRKWLGENGTTLLGYAANSVCLSICVVSIFMQGSPFDPSFIANPFANPPSTEHETLSVEELWEARSNIFYFAAGVILARFGLWVAELSVAQLLQDRVEEPKRGVINGVQNSVQQLLDMLKFFLVMLLPSPKTFGYLIIATWIFSAIGGLCHFVYLWTLKIDPEKEERERILPPQKDLTQKDNLTERTPLLHASSKNDTLT